MPSNDPVLLEQILKSNKAEVAPDRSDAEYFELFVAEQILKDHSLSYEELDSGLVGGPHDGGIDGIWLFANGDLVHEDTDLTYLKRKVDLELRIMQCKKSGGFGEEPVNKLIAVTEHLFDLSRDPRQYADRYSAALIESAKLFRETYRSLAARYPVLSIVYTYATLAIEVHPNVVAKSKDLTAKIPALFSDAQCAFEFVGAPELVAMARQKPKSSYTLTLAESPISASGAVAYISLVRLRDWNAFITNENGHLLSELFEANVRDYQGKTEVNKEIQASLQNAGPEDFWWLNNGVTVLAGKATQSGKALTIEDPQIVNGLQTSQQIFEYFRDFPQVADKRLVLVRVVVPDAEESRDRIIKATNSQTYIPPASLKATDKVQRDIEEYLRPHGIFYDRRKNHYKNEGRPMGDIVGIPKMAQALMSVLLARPDTARARPSSLIKSDADYEKLFSADHPVEIYLSCLLILRAVEAKLRLAAGLEQKDRNNVRFYAALQLARKVTAEAIPSLSKLKAFKASELTEPLVEAAVSEACSAYNDLGATDQVAKGTELKSKLDRVFAAAS